MATRQQRKRSYQVIFSPGGEPIPHPSLRAAKSEISKASGRVYWSPWQRTPDGLIIMEAYRTSEDLFLHEEPVGLVLLVEGGNGNAGV